MPKRKLVEIVEEVDLPKVLIIGSGSLALNLVDRLSHQGCLTTLAENYPQTKSELDQYDYIFQWENLNEWAKVFKTFLKPQGKMLLIETSNQAISVTPVNTRLRILRTGDVNLWNTTELVEKILKVMFSSQSTLTYDLKKKAAIPKKSFLRPPAGGSGQASTSPSPRIKSEFKKISSPPKVAALKQGTPLLPKIILTSMIILFLTILVFGGVSYYFYSSIRETASDLQASLRQSNWNQVRSDLVRIRSQFHLFGRLFDAVDFILFPLRENPLMKDTALVLSLSNNLLQTSDETITVLQKLEFSNFEEDFFSQTQNQFEQFRRSVSEAKNGLEKTALPFFPKEKYLQLLSSFESRLTVVNQVLPLAQKIFAPQTAKTYLLLFQNNMELRPTGGFIGSFALLTINSGKIIEFKILDVYDADGQLKGHVDPPYPIRKILNQPNWFLRDSNFDPDFAKSAVQAAWFLQKELGKSVDGVIAVNAFFLQNLLKVTGPLDLPDFNNEVVSADNFFSKSEVYIQKDFFPGSAQKKDFLTAVSSAMQLKLISDKNLSWMELMIAVKNALDEKNILLWGVDNQLQQLVEKNGWGGRMVTVRCTSEEKQEDCLPDYLAIVDANLGVNKANYFISKQVIIGKKVTTEGDLETTVTVLYENSNNPAFSPAVTYTNYLRIFTPLNSKLINFSLNNVPVSLKEVDREDYAEDKSSYGYLIKLAPQNKAVIKAIYSLSQAISSQTKSIQFFYQKQGGDKIAPLVLSYVFPSQYIFIPLNFTTNSYEEGKIDYTTDSSFDRVFALQKKSTP